jgi:hypothetical protein
MVSWRAGIANAFIVALAVLTASCANSPASTAGNVSSHQGTPCKNDAEKPPCTGYYGWIGADGVVPTVPAVPSTTAYVPTATPTPDKLMPSSKDVTVGLKILSNHCFGSAGCNVTYRIDPKTSVPCIPACTVTYDVVGGEQPQSGNFTIDNFEARFQSEDMIQTKSSKAKLTTKVTDIFSNS